MKRCKKDKCQSLSSYSNELAMACGGKHPATPYGDEYRLCLKREREDPELSALPEEDLSLDLNAADVEVIGMIFDALRKDARADRRLR